MIPGDGGSVTAGGVLPSARSDQVLLDVGYWIVFLELVDAKSPSWMNGGASNDKNIHDFLWRPLVQHTFRA